MKKIVLLCSRTGLAARMLSQILQVDKVYLTTQLPPASLHENDLVISLGYMRKIPKEFFERVETLNVHPGKLPNFKGKDPHLQALQAGVAQTAVTIHRVTEELDGGPIVAEVPVDIQPQDTPEALDMRLRLVAVYALAAYLLGRGAELCTNNTNNANNALYTDSL